MYAPITNFARLYVAKAISYLRVIFCPVVGLFFMSLESVKALSRFIWSWLPDTASRRTIAYNMAATHANCAIFWTLNTVKNFTKRSMEISLTLSNICPFAPQALTYFQSTSKKEWV